MSTLEAGQKFERYRIAQQIGSGISGESYEAEDPSLQHTVTLKLIHPWAHLPDSARRQFFREMQSFGSLTHRYMAPTLDYGEVYGQLYLVRHYSNTGSLLSDEGRAWYNPPLAITQAIQFTHQLALALQHIHGHGFVHGSLTFSNILVLHSPNQQPDFAPFRLADAGTAQFVRNFGQPQSSILPITAAPEQYQGKRITPATDQYALAVLLYFWLAGRPPFIGAPDEIEQCKLTKTIPALFLLNPKVTLQQEEIVRRALNIHPEARYPSIIAFAEDLLASLSSPAPATAADDLNPTSNQLPANGQIEEGQSVSDLIQSSPEPLQPPTQSAQQGKSPTQEDKTEPDTGPSLPAILSSTRQEPSSKDTGPLTPPLERLPMEEVSLTITSPNIKEPRQEVLERERITLGRAGSSTIFLNQSSVSRHHAVLVRQGRRYLLTDEHSAQGTILNGEKLISGQPYELKDGDCITIGEYILIFHRTQLSANADPSRAFYQFS